MTTFDASMTVLDDQQTTHHSEEEMIMIGDLVVWHQMPFLSVRRLTQLNCPRWSMWESSNVDRISKARTLDNTHDWYFPILLKKERPETWNSKPSPSTIIPIAPKLKGEKFPDPVEDIWSSWSGVWHASAQHASETASPLPPITDLPHEWLYFSVPENNIIASAGGLLLIKGKIGVVPLRRSKRLNPVLAESNPSSSSDTTKPAGEVATTNGRRQRNQVPQDWQHLLVCNPLTKEFRELPVADCRLLGLPSWKIAYQNGVQVNLVVNEEANFYRVILTLRDYVCVYTSTTSIWNFTRFPQESPWGPVVPSMHELLYMYDTWDYICASAHMNGCLYFADVQSTTAPNVSMEPCKRATSAATLRLFQVDAEAGKWETLELYTLRKFHIPSLSKLKYPFNSLTYEMSINPYLEIVECMGGLYAVLPAKVYDAWLIGESSEQPHDRSRETFEAQGEPGRKFGFMPLCFYIMQLLEGDGVNCGVLRIQVPLHDKNYQPRFVRMMIMASHDYCFIRNWFCCEARGSVIWVVCEDCLLSFDVVSRESKTRIIPMDYGKATSRYGKEVAGFAYRPSLHMKS